MGNFLVPFKKFLSNKNTITILGVLLGIVVLYLGYDWRVTKSIQPTQVPFCTATLVSGTKITEDHISYVSVPKETIASMTNMVTQVSEISGKLVSYDSKIPRNGFFFTENLITEEEMPDSIFSNIQDGFTIYNLKINNEKAFGNSIFPGDTIDLYMKDSMEDLLVYGRFIKEIEVLAVKDADGKNVFADKENPTEAAFLLFAVPEKLFLLLKKAEFLGVVIEPIVRNSSYSNSASPTELTNEELESMIINKTYILQNECQDLTVCG